MKLTVWQQFSSNHSNAFTIVGQFASATKATEAIREFRDILEKLLVNVEAENGHELVKLELESLGVIWQEQTLPDWLLPEVLEIDSYKNILFIESHINASSGSKLLELLLEKIGSKKPVLSGEWEVQWDRWNCEFDILDSARADAFEAMINELLTMKLEDYWAKEHETLLTTEMWWLSWRMDADGKPVDFKREGSHFQIQEAFFWFVIPPAKVLTLFTKWLEECGASNIQYSVRSSDEASG